VVAILADRSCRQPCDVPGFDFLEYRFEAESGDVVALIDEHVSIVRD